MKRTARIVFAFCALATGSAGFAQSPDDGAAPRSSVAARGEAPANPRAGSSHRFAANSQLSVDLVKLKSGKTLRGAIVRQGVDGSLTMAVPREWLRRADPGLLAKIETEEVSTRRSALEQLRDRIRTELERVAEDSGLATFLRLEQKRIEKLLHEKTPAESPQFVWFDLAKAKIARVAFTTAERRRIAAWSWSERLPNVETRSADELSRELTTRGVDPSQSLPDLSDRLPVRTQDDQEWSARMALVADALGKPLEFQGTGDLLVRSDRTTNAGDTAPLFAKLLGGQVESLLKNLLGGGQPVAPTAESSDAWLKPAIREAEREKARAFRATRVDLNLAGHQAAVNSVFVVHLSKGDWQAIWSDRDSQDGTEERPALEASITNDPQVKSALATFKSVNSLSLGTGSPGSGGGDPIRSAIRFGAATMAAQQTVNSRFFAFQAPYLQHLDGPPLWWPQ